MSYRIQPTTLPDVRLIVSTRYEDERGHFCECYRESAFRESGIAERFVQDNESRSHRGVIRGLHFQLPPHAQAKLVRVSSGVIWDVVVDLRADSPHFGRWEAHQLDAETRTTLYVPRGFAHGFQVLSESAWVQYKVSAEYAPAAQEGLRFDDPRLAIPWPLADALLSAKDRALPWLDGLTLPTRAEWHADSHSESADPYQRS